MNNLIYILCFTLGFLLQDPISEKAITCNVVEISFEEFTKIVYSQTQVKIFFDNQRMKGVRVTLQANKMNLISACETILKNTDFEVSEWNDCLVIIQRDKLISSLPNFNQNNIYSDSIDHSVEKFTESELKYAQGHKTDILKTYEVGVNGSGSKSNAKIIGRIIDDETGEPIIGATFFIEETLKGFATDQNGFFNLILPPKSYTCRVECLGFKKRKVLVKVNSSGELKLELTKEDLLIDEVQVYGDIQSNIKSKDMGLERLTPKTIKEIPVMMGERDILKVSSLLPGIVNIGEGSSGFNVRGGSADQNAFYINKVPIYNTSHLFGFFPAFNADVIKDFTIYKGYVPPNYGGKLSSIFNIITRQGNRKQFTAHGGINPVTGNLTLEGPIIKDTLTILINGRTSYSDWILSRIKDSTIRKSNAEFHDFCALINYDLSKSQASFFVYNSNDNFGTKGVNSYNYSNNGAALNLRRIFSSSIKSDFALISSRYIFNTIDQQIPSTAFKHQYSIEHLEFKTDVSHLVGEKISLDYGVNSILYKLTRGVVAPYGSGSYRQPLDLGIEKGVENSIYISNSINFFNWLKVLIGLRYSIFTPLGPRTSFVYLKDQPKWLTTITDTLHFRNNQPIKWYHSPEFRIAFNVETDSKGSIKLAISRMQQNLFMLNNTFSISPNSQWKLADYNIRPSENNQLSFGIFRNIPSNGIETSLECYYKWTSNYPEFKDGASFLDNPYTETAILQGDQKAYGVEFFLKRKNQKLEGWISYTFSRSIVHIDGKNNWNKINDGDPYPANFDIPNAVNALINYHFNRRLTFSSVVTYQTGRPITYPVSTFYINGVPYYDYSKRNKYHIPDYFRIDASLSIEGNLKKNKLIHSSMLFSIYNLTGRNNPYSVYFKTEDDLIKSYKYSIIGVPIFTVTWQFKLGNYASD